MQETIERVAATKVSGPASYETILVHVEPGLASSHYVEVAGNLARRFDAHLIGLGAETYDPAMFAAGGYADAQGIAIVQDQIAKNLEAAETAFRRDAGGADISWRAIQDYPERALVGTAHAADLIVMAPKTGRGALKSADPADVVMAAGVPVLIAPEGRSHLSGQTVVVAWKNTRECRRALAASMPFLAGAEDVIVLAVTAEDQSEQAVFETDDVVVNLKRHGVSARAQVVQSKRDPELEISQIVMLTGADLIVAGAYGHSRLREWAFGGVTDSLLHNARVFVLLSH